MILELGLRYHPTSDDMVDAHKAKLSALVDDLADMPLGQLEKAIKHWIRTSAFLPKASDLIALARGFAQSEPTSEGKRLDQATPANAKLDAEKPSFGFRWIQDETQCQLVRIVDLEKVEGLWRRKPDPPRCTPEQAAAIMKEFNIKSSILDAVVGALKPAARVPTDDDYKAIMGD